MLRKFFSSGFALSLLNVSMAQDSSNVQHLVISGNADFYYKYDFGKSELNNLTSFTNSHNSFEPGMASIKFDYKLSHVEMVADIGFGKRASEFSYNDEGLLAGIKQMYISYSPAGWFKLTTGSWVTHVGYELVDANANRNYSMSYMFTNGPFFHTGLKADITLHDHSLMIGITNPSDYKYVPQGVVNKKFLIAQYGFTPSERFKTWINYAGGENTDTSKTKQLDLILTSKLSPKLSLGYDGTVNTIKKYLGNKDYDQNKSWWGSALYLNYDPADHVGVTLREEYFSDRDGLKISGLELNGNIFSTTISASLKVDNFTFMPEFRMDRSNKNIFIKKDGSASNTAANVLFATIFQF